jgi:hypothetical protein
MDERWVFPVAVLLSCLAVSDTPFSHLAHSCHMWILEAWSLLKLLAQFFQESAVSHAIAIFKSSFGCPNNELTVAAERFARDGSAATGFSRMWNHFRGA